MYKNNRLEQRVVQWRHGAPLTLSIVMRLNRNRFQGELLVKTRVTCKNSDIRNPLGDGIPCYSRC